MGLCPVAAYLSNRRATNRLQASLLLLNLCVPGITALIMIYASQNELLIDDFWRRLLLIKMSPIYFLVIVFFMPCVVYLATGLSLLLGYSTDQFSISDEFSVIKGWTILGVIIPLVLAPGFEELGWRGYGVDSLRAYCNVFTTSVIFGILWAVWHLPAFFIKGYYHNQLWNMGLLYVVNFFVSVFLMAFLTNWVYFKTSRSIPAVILFHSVLNLSSMALKTKPCTKCLVTVLLFVIVLLIVFCDADFFFNISKTQIL
jgi:membrane protease YdiL (CAAX protease family)